MRKNTQNTAGFTMIEMLVSIAIVITCATIVVAIITASFRTSNNTSTQEKIRQAGTAALSQATGMIRFADSFNGATGTDGKPITSCESPDSDNSVAVNSIMITSGTQAHTIACSDDKGLSLDDQPLLDPSNITVTYCNLECTQVTSADPPVIKIDISLSGGSSSDPNALQENKSAISNLSQTVRMNNLNQ